MDPFIPKPTPGTYPDFYNTYFASTDERPALEQLQEDAKNFHRFILAIPQEKQLYAYAEGKWNIKQVIQHVIDTERIMSYRALCFARGEQQDLPGFNEDEYAAKGDVNGKTMELLALEFFAVRQSTIALYFGLSPAEITAKGKANHREATTNAIAWMIIGHARHHFNIVLQKYLQ